MLICSSKDSFVFKKYKNLSYSFAKNDFRYYNLKNDSKTYTYTSDYEIMNQNLFSINKEYPTKYDLRDKINVKVENHNYIKVKALINMTFDINVLMKYFNFYVNIGDIHVSITRCCAAV